VLGILPLCVDLYFGDSWPTSVASVPCTLPTVPPGVLVCLRVKELHVLDRSTEFCRNLIVNHAHEIVISWQCGLPNCSQADNVVILWAKVKVANPRGTS